QAETHSPRMTRLPSLFSPTVSCFSISYRGIPRWSTMDISSAPLYLRMRLKFTNTACPSTGSGINGTYLIGMVMLLLGVFPFSNIVVIHVVGKLIQCFLKTLYLFYRITACILKSITSYFIFRYISYEKLTNFTVVFYH